MEILYCKEASNTREARRIIGKIVKYQYEIDRLRQEGGGGYVSGENLCFTNDAQWVRIEKGGIIGS